MPTAIQQPSNYLSSSRHRVPQCSLPNAHLLLHSPCVAVFPNIPAPGGDNGPDFSDCARHHLAAKPRKGAAVLFHSIKPSGELERRSLHGACPVLKGEKW